MCQEDCWSTVQVRSAAPAGPNQHNSSNSLSLYIVYRDLRQSLNISIFSIIVIISNTPILFYYFILLSF